jgi:bacterioferritin (cytochrome b1)
MTDKSRRAIAALEAELAIAEAHAKKLSTAMPSLSDPIQKDAMAALLKEENDRAERLRNKLRLLGDAS